MTMLKPAFIFKPYPSAEPRECAVIGQQTPREGQPGLYRIRLEDGTKRLALADDLTPVSITRANERIGAMLDRLTERMRKAA